MSPSAVSHPLRWQYWSAETPSHAVFTFWHFRWHLVLCD